MILPTQSPISWVALAKENTEYTVSGEITSGAKSKKVTGSF